MSQEIPFKKGDWVVDRHTPGRLGIATGNIQVQGPFTLVELEYGPGDRRLRPLRYLLTAEQKGDESLDGYIERGQFGQLTDLKRLLTFEKLKGTLHEVIYSMDAAQIEFFPYQFKPVVKFIDSPTERMLIADEVGLGKTIEAALIWLELQARKQARRLLVVCPTHILAQQWKNELREKFIIDARVVQFQELREELNELRRKGPAHPFALIATYSSLRPPRDEHRHLNKLLGEIPELSPKTTFCQELRQWQMDFNPYDLAIFDEAHHMRNAGTANFQLGESISENAGAVLCVSATPVNNRNEDLHSLLRLVDQEFFRTQARFGELLDANQPAVQLINGLARTPVDKELVNQSLTGLADSPSVGKSPLYQRLRELLQNVNYTDNEQIAECQLIAEKLNLLGAYVSRTRRVQVKEHRPTREPAVLEVEFNPIEKRFYNAIVQIVRRHCKKNQKLFHIFQVIGLQMRAASSLSVLAKELKSGKLGDPHELLMEGFGDIGDDDILERIGNEEAFSFEETRELLDYDYEANDSKYAKLEEYIVHKLIAEKIVIFSFYRGTLLYLQQRLRASGIEVAMIHGGVKYEERSDIVEAFNSEGGPRVLLSSEVGSEGIDMHENCRCVINYDLPWNPMRVEQRIGRIDRVGQQASRLLVVHLKVGDTIEERVYDRLHARLQMFATSLGDLETVIGETVRDLTVELLSNELTPKEEEIRIARKERVIQQERKNLRLLEESGESLVALSDYVQRKIDEDHEKGRFVQPQELEDFLKDFFDRYYQGTAIAWNTPVMGCINIRLSNEAHDKLRKYIRDDQSLSARPLKQNEFAVTFRKDAHKGLKNVLRRRVHFANHLSPLVRWMTEEYRQKGHDFFKVSAMRLTTIGLSPGVYAYRIERWLMRGLRDQQQLAYGVASFENGRILGKEQSEEILQDLLRRGVEWDYPACENEAFRAHVQDLKDVMGERFRETVEDFRVNNDHVCQIRAERTVNFYDRKINNIRQRIETMKQRERSERVIRPMFQQLENTENNKRITLEENARKTEIDVEKSDVAAGIFLVEG